MANTLLQILKDNITDPSVFFVFPTQVAADSWADVLLNTMDSGTIAMERFTAWDTFKGNSIRSQKQDKKSIPSELRKLFAAHLIDENAALIRDRNSPLFESLINPEYAQEASSFTSWLSSLLPQLALWKQKQHAAPVTPEDTDLERLYEAYRNFLDANKLFDPAWETPPFDARGNRYIIFYPEVLEDFAEYQDLLEGSENITLVKADDLAPLSCAEADASFIRTFGNSRAELHALALEIRRAHEQDGIPYEDMAVSIDRDGLLLPYLERELALYSIPSKRRIAVPLTARGAGMLFPQIQECVSSNFSFESVKDLLLNNDLPWKEKHHNMEHINFGIRNSCICSFEKEGAMFDVWKDALKAESRTEERLGTFYDMLKLRLENISRAKTFKDIEESYFAFRNDFLNPEEFTEQADNVLGRCIAELAELIILQDEYPAMKIEGCFSFFTEMLSSTEYLSQSAATGVMLYPYRNAAAAPKTLHFVPAAGQDAVTVTYSPLRFLTKEKRTRLGVEDTDVSRIFLKMYAQNSFKGTWFSCAEKSFAGYTLPHSALASEKAEVPQTDDPIAEQRAWLSGQQNAFPATVSETDKAGFATWSSRAHELSSFDTALKGIDKNRLFEGDKVRISESALNDFFFCPRRWFYRDCLKLRPFSLEADLMEDLFVGILYHLILEFFFTEVQNEKGSQILNPDNPEVKEKYLERISSAVRKAILQTKGSPLSKELLSKQEAAYKEKATACIIAFCKEFYGYTVVGMEKTFTREPDNVPYMYTGKTDLILRNPDGNIVLIDFKTGKSPKPDECFPNPDDGDRLNNFQFAMYIMLWEHEHPDDKVAECYFYEIINCKSKAVIGGSGKKARQRPDMDYSIERLEAYAAHYADAILKNTLEAGITPDFKTCTGCDYRPVCRSTYSVSGDKSLITVKEDQDNE